MCEVLPGNKTSFKFQHNCSISHPPSCLSVCDFRVMSFHLFLFERSVLYCVGDTCDMVVESKLQGIEYKFYIHDICCFCIQSAFMSTVVDQVLSA